MDSTLPTAIGFAGPSGSGKTTLIEKLVPELLERGVRVGVVKHHGHPIELDTEGKDTWRFRRAGAVTTALVGEDQVALFGSGARDLDLTALLATAYRDCDLVLVEGYRTAELPTIVVAREPLPDDWTRPRRPVATATGPRGLLALEPSLKELPNLGLDEIDALADRLVELAASERRAGA